MNNEQPKTTSAPVTPAPVTHFGFRDVPVGDKQKLVAKTNGIKTNGTKANGARLNGKSLNGNSLNGHARKIPSAKSGILAKSPQASDSRALARSSCAGGTTDGGRVHASNAFIWRYRSLWKTPCGSWAGLRPCEPDEVGRAWGRKLGHTWAASNTQKRGIRFRYPG